MPHRTPGDHLPENLYKPKDRAGFRYRAGDRWEYWKVTEPEAIAEAVRRNALATDNLNSVYRVIERYKVRLLEVKNADSTMREKARILTFYQNRVGSFDWSAMTRGVLGTTWERLGPHAWQKHRVLWIDLCAFAIAKGVGNLNEAAMTLPPTAHALKRTKLRHTTEGYAAIYEAADEWLRIAMEFATASLQDRSTLVRAMRADVAGGRWVLTRSKTGAHLAVRIPPGSRLALAVQRALAFPVVGSRLIRRPPLRRSQALDEYTEVTGGYLSKAFAAARETAGAYAELPIEQRPAFRDLRSYGAWLYKEAGHPPAYVQALMAHKSARTTAIYHEGYGVTYEEVEAGLLSGNVQ